MIHSVEIYRSKVDCTNHGVTHPAITTDTDRDSVPERYPMSSQHTPGPWHYSPDVSLHNTALVYGADKYLVADAGRIHRRQPEEQIANAHLIAAAPDLLTACKGLLKCMQVEPECAIYKAHMKLAEDAIAKAGGRP